MASGATTKQSNKLILKRYSYTFANGIEANTTVRVAAGDMTPSFHYPTGYTPIAIRYFNSGSAHVVVDYILSNNHDGVANSYFLALRNVSSSKTATNITFNIDILYAPVEMVEVTT